MIILAPFPNSRAPKNFEFLARPKITNMRIIMTKEPYINVKKVRTQLWRVELTSTTGKSHTIEGTRKFIIDAILNYLYPSGIRPLKER